MKNALVSLRLTLRVLWKYPIFTLVTVVIVAIGVGANTAVFALIEEILLKPAPGFLAPELRDGISPRSSSSNPPPDDCAEGKHSG